MTERASAGLVRLAVVAPARDRCGVSDYARRLTGYLPERFEISAIDLPNSSSVSQWREAAAQADGADLVHLHYEYGLFRTVKPYRNRLLTFLRRVRPPALVTLHDLLPRLAPRWLERPPYGVVDALRDTAYLPFFGRWEKSLYSSAAHWLVHTREHEQAVERVIGGSRVSRLLHPIPSSQVAWRYMSQSDRAANLVSPGFIKSHKGYSRLLGEIAKLPEVTWTLAGGPQDERDRDYADRLCGEIESYDLAARIHVTGYLPLTRLETTMANTDLAVFPFDRVTGSGSVALAIALGMPVMATDLPGLRELVEKGAGVELLPHGEPASWSDRIACLLASPDRLQSLAAANRDFAREHSFARAGPRLGRLFEQVLARTL